MLIGNFYINDDADYWSIADNIEMLICNISSLVDQDGNSGYFNPEQITVYKAEKMNLKIKYELTPEN